ncbi:MAG: hypothetical protein ACI8YO_001565 [Gammaproteobacteria bacterium]|jgi:hypothetical protein
MLLLMDSTVNYENVLLVMLGVKLSGPKIVLEAIDYLFKRKIGVRVSISLRQKHQRV